MRLRFRQTSSTPNTPQNVGAILSRFRVRVRVWVGPFGVERYPKVKVWVRC
jgi:hypothetical protein